MVMSSCLPSYWTASPIQMLTQMLESDYLDHILQSRKSLVRYFNLTKQNKILNLPVLGCFWGTALWIAVILHARSWFLSQGSVAQTVHETCSFLTLHCQKSQSLCLMQSSPTLLIGQHYCWRCLHCIAFSEDSWPFAQADLKRKNM